MTAKKKHQIISYTFLTLFLVVFIAMIVILWDPILASLKDKTLEPLTLFLSLHRFEAAVFVVLIQTLIVVVMVIPSLPFQLMAGVLFGYYIGFLYLFIGVIIGHQIVYMIGRLVGDALLSQKHQSKMFKLEEKQLRKHRQSVLWIVLTYLVPGIPYGVIAFLLIKYRVGYYRYTLITSFGSIIPLSIAVLLGDFLPSTNPTWFVPLFIGLMIFVMVGAIILKKKHSVKDDRK